MIDFSPNNQVKCTTVLINYFYCSEIWQRCFQTGKKKKTVRLIYCHTQSVNSSIFVPFLDTCLFYFMNQSAFSAASRHQSNQASPLPTKLFFSIQEAWGCEYGDAAYTVAPKHGHCKDLVMAAAYRLTKY